MPWFALLRRYLPPARIRELTGPIPGIYIDVETLRAVDKARERIFAGEPPRSRLIIPRSQEQQRTISLPLLPGEHHFPLPWLGTGAPKGV